MEGNGTTDRSRSIQQLTGTDYGDPDEELRLMIGQKAALTYLVPIALERLADNPFLSGERYLGDLLCAVMSLDRSFWESHRSLYEELRLIILEVEMAYESLQPLLDKHKERLE